MARQKKSERMPPTEPGLAAVASTDGRTANRPSVQHGPPRPLAAPFGVARLRHLLGLSDRVPVDQVCEDAAARIEELSNPPRRSLFSRLRDD